MNNDKSARQQATYREIGRLGRNSRGAILVLFTVLVATLLLFATLALDGGLLYHQKRRVQIAADAAAMGGAFEILKGNATLVAGGAKNDAAMNGFDHDDEDVTVTVHHPPISGGWTGNNQFVEVIVRKDAWMTFSRALFGQTAAVAARAVAGAVEAYDGCVLVMNPTARDALKIVGNGELKASCGIMVNSIDDNAIDTTANACLKSLKWIGTAGYAGIGGECVSPTPVNNALAMEDPLATLEKPPIPKDPIATGLRINEPICQNETPSPQFIGTWPPFTCDADGVYHHPAGRYDNGFNIQAGTHVFGPGTIVLNTGLKITGNNTVISGSEVTFFNTSFNTSTGDYKVSPIDIGGGVESTLSAPTGEADPMEGILFYFDRDLAYIPSGNHIIGHADSTFTGTIYALSQDLDYGGSSNSEGSWTYIIADTLVVHGEAGLNGIHGPKPGVAGTPDVFKVTMVE